MLSGEPGSGKTWVALAIAAALTRGRDPFTGESPSAKEARCSIELLEHLEHLHETNDLFGNVAKSQTLRQTNVSTTAPRRISVPREQIEEILKEILKEHQ